MWLNTFENKKLQNIMLMLNVFIYEEKQEFLNGNSKNSNYNID